MAYHAETFHIAGAVAACMLAERQGDDVALVYAAAPSLGFPAGLTWRELALAIWNATDGEAGAEISVDTLAPAPYRVMIGDEQSADAIGWIDVCEDADEIGALPDVVTDWIA